MSDKAILAGGVALGALLLLDRGGGGKRPFAGEAATAAGEALFKRSTIAGVSFVVPSSRSPLDTWKAMRDALVSKYGAIPNDPSGKKYPRGLTSSQLQDVCAAWLEAFAAGRNAVSTLNANAAVNFAIVDVSLDQGWVCLSGGNEGASEDICDRIDTLGCKPTAVGLAVCELVKWRRTLAWMFGFVTDDHVRNTFDRTLKLASEMEGADFVTDGVRKSDQAVNLDDIAGAVVSAGAATAKFVGGLAGDAIGGIAGAVVGSSVFWAAGLALVVWRFA